MATRDLEKNQNTTAKKLENIQKQAEKSIAADYRTALDLLTAALTKRAEAFGKLNNETLSKFGRRDKLLADIFGIFSELNKKQVSKIKRNSRIQLLQAYFRNAWCIDTALGVPLKWRIKKR